MKDTYTVYYSGDKVQKLRTLKSYVKYRAHLRLQAEIRYARTLWNDRAGIWAELKAEVQQSGLERQV